MQVESLGCLFSGQCGTFRDPITSSKQKIFWEEDMKDTWLLLLFLFLTACVPTSQTEPEAAAPTPTPASDYDFSGVHLRLRNLSGRDFEEVTLTIASQAEQIGSLPQAAVSDYFTFTAVHQPPTIRATSNQTVYEWTADPDMAGGLMAGGEFALELTIENDELAVLFLMENPFLQDAQYYAEEMGVSIEEALARLDTQSEDTISNLNNQLQANEANTFAGLWLQHEPEYRVVVAFTRDGEETIQKYVAEDSELAQLIEVRSAQYSYAQLQTDQQAVLRILDRMQMPVGVGIMVQENYVELAVTDRVAFDAALAAANTTLPASVIVNTVYEPVGDNPPVAITPVPDLFMPQLKVRDFGFMEALISGELVVQDGCLRVQAGDESTLVIWQADYFLTDNDGILEILDETGAVVAQIGEMVYIGGGEQPSVNDSELRQPIPAQCGGPYWRMGQFLPEEYIPNVSGEPTPQIETINPATFDIPDLDTWVRYESPTLQFALRHPPEWTVTERGNGITLTAPQTAVIDSETILWSIWVSVREKFAEDASLYDLVVNDYHFEVVFEQFEETLTEETINGRTAYRSTIIPAAGGQLSIFFEDDGRFVEVTLRPFDEERPYENQEAFAELFAMLLETVAFAEEMSE
jgi:hypothetical protein